MKQGWTRGIMMGALVGVSAMTVATMMNQRSRRQMMKTVSNTASKMADKAGQIMK